MSRTPACLPARNCCDGPYAEIARVRVFTLSSPHATPPWLSPLARAGIFIAHGKEDMLVTRNLVAGESVYGEKRVSVEVREELPSPKCFCDFSAVNVPFTSLLL